MLGSGSAADLGGATSTYSDSRRLLLPRRLDLGLTGLDPFEDFVLFSKIDFGYRSATTDTKKGLFFVSEKWYQLAHYPLINRYEKLFL
jgi:hypothetical protein